MKLLLLLSYSPKVTGLSVHGPVVLLLDHGQSLVKYLWSHTAVVMWSWTQTQLIVMM